MYGETNTVFSITSTPGHRKKCIRRCAKSPLKKYGDDGAFAGGGDDVNFRIVQRGGMLYD